MQKILQIIKKYIVLNIYIIDIIKYDKIAKIITKTHNGKTVLFVYPRPKSLITPSLVNTNPGLINIIIIKNIKNNINVAKIL